MTKYSESEIWNKYDKQLEEAKFKLEELEVYCRDVQCNMNMLNGWIFEHVVRHCLTEELKEQGLNPEMSEQYKFEYDQSESGRKKFAIIDLKVNNKVLVEIKTNGYQMGKWNNTNIDEKYKKIKNKAEEERLVYLYISKKEQNPKRKNSYDYKKRAIDVFGELNTFFLDEGDNWQRFVDRVSGILKEESKK